MARAMQFKRLFYSSLYAILVSGTLGIAMAYLGYGVWALVVQYLTNYFMITVVLWLTVRWRPQWMLSLERLRGLFLYGWKIIASALLETVFNNVYGLMVGKIYKSETLGYYNSSEQFPRTIVINMNDATGLSSRLWQHSRKITTDSK